MRGLFDRFPRRIRRIRCATPRRGAEWWGLVQLGTNRPIMQERFHGTDARALQMFTAALRVSGPSLRSLNADIPSGSPCGPRSLLR